MRQAIYGLRESPAIWAAFRDAELKKAKIIVEEDGKVTECKLQPLVSESQVWKTWTPKMRRISRSLWEKINIAGATGFVDSLMLTVDEEEAFLGVVEPVPADEGVLRMAPCRVGELLLAGFQNQARLDVSGGTLVEQGH